MSEEPAPIRPIRAHSVRGLDGTLLPSALQPPEFWRRERYELEERLRELELRLAEQVEAGYLREVELRALQREVEVKAAYIATLEHAQGGLHGELRRLTDERDAVAASARAVQADLESTRALVAAMRNRRAYRLTDHAVALLRLPRRLAGYARRRLRRSRG